jgi:HPt (histidine-containing phosphotransfer) domain-containing protein
LGLGASALLTMTTNPGMAEALARLWTKFLPEITQRVAVLEAAAQALSAGLLSAEQRSAAHAAAHKLAGTLGTFGLHQGTDLARKAEALLAEEIPQGDAVQLEDYARELRALLDSRQAL